jgi:hypothetical protein
VNRRLEQAVVPAGGVAHDDRDRNARVPRAVEPSDRKLHLRDNRFVPVRRGNPLEAKRHAVSRRPQRDPRRAVILPFRLARGRLDPLGGSPDVRRRCADRRGAQADARPEADDQGEEDEGAPHRPENPEPLADQVSEGSEGTGEQDPDASRAEVVPDGRGGDERGVNPADEQEAGVRSPFDEAGAGLRRFERKREPRGRDRRPERGENEDGP